MNELRNVVNGDNGLKFGLLIIWQTIIMMSLAVIRLSLTVCGYACKAQVSADGPFIPIYLLHPQFQRS